MANKTGFKSLDVLGNDPRVELIENEGRVSDGGDGLWLYTAPGFCNGDHGSHIIHENTVRDILSAAKSITPCDCKDCLIAR